METYVTGTAPAITWHYKGPLAEILAVNGPEGSLGHPTDSTLEQVYQGGAWKDVGGAQVDPSGNTQFQGDVSFTESNGAKSSPRRIICEFDINGDSSIPTTETAVTLVHKPGTSFALPKNCLLPSLNKPQVWVSLRHGINHRFASSGLTIRLRAGSDPTLANNTLLMVWYIDLRRVNGLTNLSALVESFGWLAVAGGSPASTNCRSHAWWNRGEATQSANLANTDIAAGAGGFVEIQPTIDTTVDQPLILSIQWDAPSGFSKVTHDGFYFRMTGKSAYRGGNLNSLNNIRSAYYPGSNGLSMYGCASGRGIHVAVGQLGNVHVSRDGNNWQPVKPPVTTTLRDVCWFDAAGLFIACGDSNVILTSPDGFVWTLRTSGVSLGTSVKIAAGSAKAFIVGYGSGKVLSSSDGITWAEQTLGTAYTLYNVAAAGAYVMCLGTAGRLAWSADSGATWSFVTSGSTSFTGGAIDLTLGAAVAVGAGVCSYTLSISSPSWQVSATAFSSAPFVSASSDGTKFAVVTSGEEIWSSPTGATWTNQTTTPSGSGQFWGDVGQIEL